MFSSRYRPSFGMLARFWLWTLYNQRFLNRQVVTYVWLAVIFIFGLTLTGLLTMENALEAILYGGLTIGVFLWTMIERRKSWLLSIKDHDLREAAHEAMLSCIDRQEPPSDRKMARWPWFGRKKDCPHC